MSKSPTIDIHAHYFPESFIKILEEEGQAYGLTVDRNNPKGIGIGVKGGSQDPLSPAFTDIDLRLKEMDRQRVDIHALSLTRPMVYWADGALGLKLSRAVNDALAEAHLAYPDRLFGLAVLPMQEPALALEELERSSKLAGIRGIYMGTNVNGRDLSDPEFLPVFQRMEKLGLPLFLHPLDVIGAARLKPNHLFNVLGFPFDTTVAAAHLVFGGVLDTCPTLEVCLVHGGGVFPYLVGRMNKGYEIWEDCRTIEHEPSAYLQRFTYDTITHDPDLLAYLIGRVGPERVMLGSDYCFKIGYDRPVEVVTGLSSLSGEEKAGILGSNAARLLKLT